MTHSVSHKLIIELNDTDVSLVTLKKDGLVLIVDQHKNIDKISLTQILQVLPDIYSDIQLLVRKSDFLMVPEAFYNINHQDLYGVNYTLSDTCHLKLEKTESGPGVLFPLNTLLFDCVYNKFPRVKVRHEAGVIIEKLVREHLLKDNSIFISLNQQHIIIIAVKDGLIHLCNSYKASTVQETFYFVMLSYEQLQLQPTEDALKILGHHAKDEEIFKLLSQYIRQVEFWNEVIETESKIDKSSSIYSSFPLQSLICE